MLIEGHANTRIDNYADCVLFNVIYNVDEDNAFYSVVAAPYYRIEGNDSREDYAPAAIYFVALILVQFWMCAFTIEYIMPFLVMTAVCIAVTAIWNKDTHREETYCHRRMTYAFIISGAATCFLDFLTCETLTFTIPFILYMILCKCHAFGGNATDISIRTQVMNTVKWGTAWFVSYAAMFGIKWALVYGIVEKSAFFNVLENAAYRIEGTVANVTFRMKTNPSALPEEVSMAVPVDEAGSILDDEALGFEKENYKIDGWKLADGTEIEAGTSIEEVHKKLIKNAEGTEPGNKSIVLTAVWEEITEPTDPSVTEEQTDSTKPTDPTKPTDSTEPEQDSTSDTGDSFNIMPWLILAAVAAIGAVVMTSRKRA